MKKIGSKLLEGALLGAALGVAAGMLFAPKSGKKLRGDIRDRAADFYKFVSPKLKQLKNMSESQYKAFMKTAIRGYSKAKKLSADESGELARHAQEFWKHFRKHF